MRSDMAKLIVTRPRVGGNGNVGRMFRQANRSFDDLPTKESMRKKHRRNYNGKEFSDYLAPIKRFIEGTVGRPWDKVYSEICQQLPGDNTIQQHVFLHIDQYIAIKVIRCSLSESNTGLVAHDALGGARNYGGRSRIRPGQLYVDPDDGIIKRAKIRQQEVKVAKPKTMQAIDNEHVAVKHNGIWYLVEIKPYTVEYVEKEYPNGDGTSVIRKEKMFVVDGVHHRELKDVFAVNGAWCSRRHFDTGWHATSVLQQFYGGRNVYGVSKQQMNARDLRRYGLEND